MTPAAMPGAGQYAPSDLHERIAAFLADCEAPHDLFVSPRPPSLPDAHTDTLGLRPVAGLGPCWTSSRMVNLPPSSR